MPRRLRTRNARHSAIATMALIGACLSAVPASWSTAPKASADMLSATDPSSAAQDNPAVPARVQFPCLANLSWNTSDMTTNPAVDGVQRPIIIAHRGASGYLPEHTLPGYALGFGLGADWLEPDVVLTRDGELICLHDIHLERTTDVETAFPDRARPDGRWYAIDFTLDEIRSLKIDGPAEHGDGSGPLPMGGGFGVPTLRELLELIHLLEVRTGRRAGIIIEPKNPAFHRSEGQPIEEPLQRLLAEFGLTRRSDSAVVQSFDASSIRYLRETLSSDLHLCFLAGNAEDIERVGGLAAVAPLVQSVGLHWKLAEANDAALLQEAHGLGLETYPWTFGRDVGLMVRFLHEHKVTGLFTDYPDLGVQAVHRRPAAPVAGP